MLKMKYFFIDIEKEEKWIASMQEKGYTLNKVWPSWALYDFKPKTKEQTIRIDFHQFKKDEDFQEYLALFEDYGWKHMGGTREHGCLYFERTREDAGNEIFSDRTSKAAMYSRLADFWMSYTWIMIGIAIALYYLGHSFTFILAYAGFCVYLVFQAKRWAKIEAEGLEKIK